MSKILVSCLPASGHLNPILAIAQALNNDHELMLATDYQYHEQVERAGIEPIRLYYPNNAVQNIMQQFQRPARWISQFHPKPPETYFFDHLLTLSQQLIQIINEFQPDVLLTDLNFYAGPIAADATNIPYATYCAIVNTLRSSDAPPYGLGSDWYPPHHPMRLLWPMLNIPVEWVLWRHDLIANKVRQKLGLQASRGAMLAHSPYLSMIPTTDAYAYSRRYVPTQLMYVGPVTTTQRGEIHDDFPWEWLDNERPTIYVSMGTVVGAAQIFQAVIDIATQSTQWKAVLAVGRNTEISQFQNVPSNVLIRSFVPQLELLKHVDGVISHGGNNTVTETLMNGLPLLVIPMSADQPESAGRVKAFGAGLRMRPGLAKGIRLKKAIERILFEPNIREAAQQIAKIFKRTNGKETCAALITRLAEDKKPIYRKYPSPTITLDNIDEQLQR